MSLFILVFLIGTGIILAYQSALTKEYSDNNRRLEQKETLSQKLDRTFNEVFFDMRGYYAFRNPVMKENALKQQNSIAALTEELEEMAETEQDRLFLAEVKDFSRYYFTELLPPVIAAFNSGNGDKAVENLRNNGATSRVEDFQQTLSDYRMSQDQHVENNFTSLSAKIKKLQYSLVVFLSLILLALALVLRTFFTRIGTPLHKLATAAEDVGNGKDANLYGMINRQDELGILSRSFDGMIRSIQDNEQNLFAQNEELLAQQDELQVQQSELENALSIMKEREYALKRRNDLINGMANSLDKQQVLKSIVQNMCKVINADRGIILLFNKKRDYASFGLNDRNVEMFLKHEDNGFVKRARETKQAFAVQLESRRDELGYHDGKIHCSDLYLPVISYNGETEAIMVYSRFAGPFSDDEIKEYEALSRQINISLENLKLYEATENGRTLTQDILNTIHEGVQLVNHRRTIIQTNTKLCEILNNCPMPGQMENRKFDEWAAELKDIVVESDALVDFMNQALDDRARGRSYIYQLMDKKVIQVYYEPLYRGSQKFGTLFVHRDITKEYEVDQMKSEFVSTVSHELRTPLASVLGFTELMLTRELKPERQKKYLTTILQEAKRLTSLINDFLDVQRMEAGKQTYDKKYLDLIPIIEESAENQRIQTSLHSFELINDAGEATVLGDRDKILQVFNNLISNGIKYSPEGGKLSIRVYLEDKLLKADVSDEGLGIPAEALDKLFTKFYRVDNSDRRKIGGTGLGLAIVKEIMKAHDGDITVKSKLKEGSTFTVSFPAAVMARNMEEFQPSSLEGNSNDKVFVVEDDAFLASLLEAELKDSGFSVELFTDGEAALGTMKRQTPDAVVLDIMLADGGLNGWDILREMKEREELSLIPVFISSALDEKQKGLTFGAKEYLTKPYQPSKLSKAIKETLRKKGEGEILIPAPGLNSREE